MHNFLILTASVNYLDYLFFTYLFNKNLIKKYNCNYCIITDKKDVATKEFCKNNAIAYHETDAFYSFNNQPAAFNRAGAINDFLNRNMDNLSSDWILLLDSDIILNDQVINNFITEKNKEYFYGCGRDYFLNYDNYKNSRTQGREECKFLGFFQLFNIDYLTEIYNNGNFNNYNYKDNLIISNYNVAVHDALFANLFSNKQSLGYVTHIGESCKNWNGRVTEKWN